MSAPVNRAVIARMAYVSRAHLAALWDAGRLTIDLRRGSDG